MLAGDASSAIVGYMALSCPLRLCACGKPVEQQGQLILLPSGRAGPYSGRFRQEHDVAFLRCVHDVTPHHSLVIGEDFLVIVQNLFAREVRVLPYEEYFLGAKDCHDLTSYAT